MLEDTSRSIANLDYHSTVQLINEPRYDRSRNMNLMQGKLFISFRVIQFMTNTPRLVFTETNV